MSTVGLGFFSDVIQVGIQKKKVRSSQLVLEKAPGAKTVVPSIPPPCGRSGGTGSHPESTGLKGGEYIGTVDDIATLLRVVSAGSQLMIAFIQTVG